MVSRRVSTGHIRSGVARSEAGVTMVELVVTMFVFAIFLVAMTSSLIGITKAVTQAQTVSRSSTGVLNVFQAFDRAVRYADVINPPGSTSNGRYVEFRAPGATTGAAATCTQWRYVPSSKTLESRTWPDGSTGSATAWATKLSSVFDDGGNYPFVLIPAGSGGSPMQQLTLTVDAGNAVRKTALVSTTFAARNSTVQSNSGGPVCSAGTMRP